MQSFWRWPAAQNLSSYVSQQAAVMPKLPPLSVYCGLGAVYAFSAGQTRNLQVTFIMMMVPIHIYLFQIPTALYFSMEMARQHLPSGSLHLTQRRGEDSVLSDIVECSQSRVFRLWDGCCIKLYNTVIEVVYYCRYRLYTTHKFREPWGRIWECQREDDERNERYT